MKKQKVCLVTGAAGTIGQHLLSHLVSSGYKVLALGEATDSFFPEVLKNKKIKITTALPISAEQYKKNDIQFCFGDMSDISFLASIFSAADKGNIEIEFIIHLSAHKLSQKRSPAAYHPESGDMVNMLEITRAYWQSHKKIMKGFFYAADTSNRFEKSIEKMIKKLQEKECFPIIVYHTHPLSDIVGRYHGKTSLASLYRFISPIKTPLTSMKWKKDADDELGYIAGLKQAISKVLEQIKKRQEPCLDK